MITISGIFLVWFFFIFFFSIFLYVLSLTYLKAWVEERKGTDMGVAYGMALSLLHLFLFYVLLDVVNPYLTENYGETVFSNTHLALAFLNMYILPITVLQYIVFKFAYLFTINKKKLLRV